MHKDFLWENNNCYHGELSSGVTIRVGQEKIGLVTNQHIRPSLYND